jgi:hypothetical protein
MDQELDLLLRRASYCLGALADADLQGGSSMELHADTVAILVRPLRDRAMDYFGRNGQLYLELHNLATVLSVIAAAFHQGDRIGRKWPLIIEQFELGIGNARTAMAHHAA